MSDTRSSFPVPASRDDGAQGAAPAGPADGRGRTPAPWPMPGHAQPSATPFPPSDASWPDPPDSGQPASGWGSRRRPAEEEPGEVTAWGYPPYREARPGPREPQPPAPRDPLDTGTAPPAAPSAPRPAGPAPVRGQERDAVQAPEWARGREHDALQTPERAPAWAPQPSPRQAPPERPFSAWETSPGQEAGPPFAGAAAERPPGGEDLPADEPAAPPARKKREPYLDNVKFVLIALVVAGHSLVPTMDAHSAKSAYMFIYTFHMPAFVLISGYLGRNFWNSNAKINKLVDTMLVPYVVVEIGYAVLRYALGQKWTLTIIDPAWLNWYLLALVLWRISTPIWTRMRQPLLVAVVIYMVAGFSEISGDFSIDRFFGLLPFYVLGLMLKPEHFDLLKPLWVRIVSGVVVAGGAGVAIFLAPHVNLKPVYFRYSFKSMDMSWWVGLGVRGAMLVAALALSVALLALVPRRETWFSDLGTRTLYAYLLHGVVVLIAKDQGWLDVSWLHGPLGVLAIMSSSVALAIVLCLPETRTAFKWLLEPRLVWLYRRPAESRGTGGEPPAPRESSTPVPR
ncbi:acyltransferase family protein [Planomonospora sp. ID91781]|uniref:Fucose 4-O-acetylase-like protein n=1 Tax=Planomonospora sphaerica TaxID=161355 RepID=A0A171BI29_9ACTN|nr:MULTISPECIES: acyltransferase family protein [Planomonospora]MBG0820921.1 acyltransferase family protein [Planomonospora sp. ID91781]GAT65135.1 fucose 4-O-acetylase-like protein [Planomonospora sphaerica]